MRIFMANVGANSSHQGLFSPIFADGTFEFLPIPVTHHRTRQYIRRSEWPGAVSYRDLRSHNYPDRDLLCYVPQKLWDIVCHNDPEFVTLTYGDVGDNGRSAALTRMQKGDVLLFLARLEDWVGERRTGWYGFYLIGGLLAEYAGWITGQSPELDRFTKNDHVIRRDDKFWGIAGSDQSRRFKRAVPITREICDRVLRDARGKVWNWDKNTELGTISSYTRACRSVLDTNDDEQHGRTIVLREWIAQHTGSSDAELLELVA
ncbi:MAG: hypothetical protein F4X64_07550 [Chloroflexi bacterium]|nr:hypothetical protein [Chloroflexota bacterium]